MPSAKTIITAVLLFYSGIHAAAQTIPDSATIAVGPGYNNVSGFHTFWLGKSYRKLWATPVSLPVLSLSTAKGGLTILQRGGGLQTKSLRLKDPSGQEWVLRTVQKYPEFGLQEYLRKTVIKDILQDQVATAHPFGSVTVPPFANALGVPHSNPIIVYLAKDTALGNFENEFADAAYLFEEREPIGMNTDNTDKLKKQMRKDNDNRIEQHLVLRARLLDMLLGDWDRHEDQWRWQVDKTKDGIIYSPVPRDRDQVYYNTTGIFPWIIAHQWLMSKFQGFHNKIRDINGFNFNARYFDRYFLNSLSEDDWKQEISFVQTQLTDSLIDSAIALMPKSIYELSGEKISTTLKNRRNNITKEGMQYYRFLAAAVDIPTSDKTEYFDMQYTPEGNLKVTIYKIKKSGARDKIIYQRTFVKGITKEIRLYGFDGNDVFNISGNKSSSIKIRMIGGADADSFNIANEVNNKSSVFIYDQFNDKNILPAKNKAKLRLSNDSLVNTYNDKAFNYDRIGPEVLANYNIDKGVLIRVGFLKEKQGFRKEPYGVRQEFLASYSTGRSSYAFDYNGIFKKAIGVNDLHVSINAKGPNNTQNFFGIGNETEFINKGDREIGYYRSLYDMINGSVSIMHPFNKTMQWYGGVAGQYYTSAFKKNTDRFLGKYDTINPQQEVFKNSTYAGLVTGFVVDTRNDTIFPSKGIYWLTDVSGMHELGGTKDNFGTIFSQVSAYITTGKKANFVIANRIVGGTVIGSPKYYQLLGIGGLQSMRGFHTNRFAGYQSFYHNFEMRCKLFDFNAYILPGTFGLVAFNDIGRVWARHKTSDRWHHSYGGGFYLVPAKLLIIQAVMGFSEEGHLPYITLGFRF